MAGNTIEIIFEGVDNVSAVTRNIAGDIRSFSGAVGDTAQPIAAMTGSLLTAHAQITALAAAYGGYAVVQFAKFQDATIDLQKVLGNTDNIEEFKDLAIELSEKYGVASANVLQGVANFKQAGFSAKEAGQLQKDALDLVVAGDVNAANATEILIAQLKGFKAEAGEAARFTEAMNNVSDKYATNLGELAKGMSAISPIAAKMGFSFEETTGLITPIIEVFRNGGESANALKTGLLKLIDDSKPVADALAAIGVKQKDVNGEMRSGKDIFEDVGEAFKGLSKKQQLLTAKQIVGIDQAGKMVEVFSQLGKVHEITAAAMAKTGSISKRCPRNTVLRAVFCIAIYKSEYG